jgi:triacylglycerol lipase
MGGADNATDTRLEGACAVDVAIRSKAAMFAPNLVGNAFFGGRSSTKADIGWIGRSGPPPRNSTDTFKTINTKAMAGARVLPANADQYVYLCVGGIFSNGFPEAMYLKENIDALKSQNCDARRVPIQTKTSVEANAKVIRDFAMKVYAETGKKVMFIGHSKGGLDSGAAIAIYPELKAITAGLITMQSPWGGSPIAADMGKDPIQKAAASFFVKKILGGDPACGVDLQHDTRQSFLAKYPLPRDVKTVCLATMCADPVSTVAWSGAYIAANYGVKSDGLVVPTDAFIPGCRSVLLSGLDHMDTVSPSPRRQFYTPRSITLSLVALALS